MPDSTTTNFLDQLRDLAATGELALALDQLAGFLKAQDRGLYREALTQRSRIGDFQRRERQGVIGSADRRAELAELTAAVLATIDHVERRLDRRLMPMPTALVRFDPPAASTLEKIFGANHLKSIAWLGAGLKKARSVCHVQTPNSAGTGFMLPGRRMVTNHHVIRDSECAAASTVQFGFEENEQGQVMAGVTYRLAAQTAIISEKYDVCIVNVEPESSKPPVEEWGILEWSAAAPGVGEHVTIIQHSGGGPKQIAITANQVVNIFDHRLQYSTDTLPGSSGSPVFNDDWKVVALHHAGGNLLKNAHGERVFANEGILAEWIVPLLPKT